MKHLIGSHFVAVTVIEALWSAGKFGLRRYFQFHTFPRLRKGGMKWLTTVNLEYC